MIFFRLLFGGNQSTFQRISEADFYRELEESVRVLKGFFFRLLFGGNHSTFQRRNEAYFFGELQESVWVLKVFFEATVWRKLIHISEGILGLLFE